MQTPTRSSTRHNWSLLFCMTIGACISGGCTTLSFAERYQALDGDQKLVFLAYYPDLTPLEQRLFLDDPNTIEEILSERPEIDPHRLRLKPQRSSLQSISILPTPGTLITEGQRAELKAIAHFDQGKSSDISSDVRWEVIPPIAQVHRSTLEFDCIHSDVTVSVRFLDEFESQSTLRVRKKIASLSVTGQEHFSQTHRYEFTELRLIAKCEDGTEQEVSCQANWSADPRSGHFSTCGYFTPSVESLKEGRALIQAHYADQSLKYWLDISGLEYK